MKRRPVPLPPPPPPPHDPHPTSAPAARPSAQSGRRLTMAGRLLTARRDPGHARSPPPRAASSGARPLAHIVSALRPLKRRRGRRGALFQPRPDRRSSGGAGGPPRRNYFLSLRGTTSRRRRRWRRARHGGGSGGGAPEVERRRPGQASARPIRFAHPLPPRLRAWPWRSPRPPDARCPSSSRVRRAARGAPAPAAAPSPPPRLLLTRLPVSPQSCIREGRKLDFPRVFQLEIVR